MELFTESFNLSVCPLFKLKESFSLVKPSENDSVIFLANLLIDSFCFSSASSNEDTTSSTTSIVVYIFHQIVPSICLSLLLLVFLLLHRHLNVDL